MAGHKVNKTGRNKPLDHFTKMYRATLQTPAWAALTTSAQALYPFVKLEWRGPNSNNNGHIRFSYRQAAKAIGVSVNTAMHAFHELQAKGFLVVTEMGVLGIEGDARGPSYEVTEIELPGKPRGSGREVFRQWRKGKEFPVAKHPKNNRSGKNGRRIPSSNFRRSHHQKGEETSPCTAKPILPIFKLATFSAQPHVRPSL
ncbi:hypothetical protein [Rhodobacter sp. SY28-1]|uniref:hypothetical protein n=1 Tax=Rhodobacter sp. SY28-1 TaxID=2562317 RepID=UPI0010C07120|nr:hypothetical protein [Rhodobacter sp. SY28-1]